MTPRQRARHILKEIMPRPVSPDEITVCDRLTDVIARYERFIMAVCLVDAKLRDGHTTEGIALMHALVDEQSSLEQMWRAS